VRALVHLLIWWAVDVTVYHCSSEIMASRQQNSYRHSINLNCTNLLIPVIN